MVVTFVGPLGHRWEVKPDDRSGPEEFTGQIRQIEHLDATPTMWPPRETGHEHGDWIRYTTRDQIGIGVNQFDLDWCPGVQIPFEDILDIGHEPATDYPFWPPFRGDLTPIEAPSVALDPLPGPYFSAVIG